MDAPARRRQILHGAIEVFARNGFRGTTTLALASAAQVSEGTLYLHFPTKQHLYRAILEEKSWAGGVRPGEISAMVDRPIAEALAAVVQKVVRRHRQDKTVLRLLLFSALEDEQLSAMVMRRHLQGPFRELVGLLKAAYPAAPDRELEVAARGFVGMMVYEVLTRNLLRVGGGRLPTLDRVSVGYVRLLLRGIANLNEGSA